MKILSKISRSVRRVVKPLVFVLGGVMFVAVIAQVIFRYVLSQPLAWSEELARYLMVWGACLATAEAYAEGKHVGVTMILDSVKPGLRKVMELIIHAAVVVLMVIIMYQGFLLSFLLRDQVSPALELPMMWAYMAVPVGATLVFIHALDSFFTRLRQQSADK